MTYLRTISSGREVFSGYATCAFKVMRKLHNFNYLSITAFCKGPFKLRFDYNIVIHGAIRNSSFDIIPAIKFMIAAKNS
jgi:hypothetical protein